MPASQVRPLAAACLAAAGLLASLPAAAADVDRGVTVYAAGDIARRPSADAA